MKTLRDYSNYSFNFGSSNLSYKTVQMKKIIIVDDHLPFRQKIKYIIENEGFGKVIGEAENGNQYLDLLKTHKPDFVIMDAVKFSKNESETSKIAIMNVPDLKVMHLTLPDEIFNNQDADNTENEGLADRTTGKMEFEKAFRAILNGEIYLLN